jgi:hypothetical protein
LDYRERVKQLRLTIPDPSEPVASISDYPEAHSAKVAIYETQAALREAAALNKRAQAVAAQGRKKSSE